MKKIPLSKIVMPHITPPKWQHHVDNIARSMLTDGFDPSRPLLVYKEYNTYQILDGVHRALAAREAHLTRIPARIEPHPRLCTKSNTTYGKLSLCCKRYILALIKKQYLYGYTWISCKTCHRTYAVSSQIATRTMKRWCFTEMINETE